MGFRFPIKHNLDFNKVLESSKNHISISGLAKEHCVGSDWMRRNLAKKKMLLVVKEILEKNKKLSGQVIS